MRNTFSALFIAIGLSTAALAAPTAARADAPPAPCSITPVTHGSGTSVGDRVTTLEDVEEIKTLKARYMHLIDQIVTDSTKVPELLDLFAINVCADYNIFGRFRGKTQLEDFFRVTFPSLVSWTLHLGTDPIISAGALVATGRWHYEARAVFKASPGAGVQYLLGSYGEDYVKTPSGWKIRTLMLEITTPPSP